jgi:hypothetical protein
MAILSPDTLDYVKARVPVFNPWADHLPESDRPGQIPVFAALGGCWKKHGLLCPILKHFLSSSLEPLGKTI